jgi:MFS family permease
MEVLANPEPLAARPFNSKAAMLAQYLAPRLARAGIHYGWVVMAVTFIVSLTAAGAMGLPGALILPLSKAFGWDVGEISSALALRILLYGLMAPFAAALMQRYGVKRMIVAALALIVAGLVLALTMSRPWQLFLYWGVLVGLGTGITALVMSAIVATRWFSQRRGVVLGVLTASTATGQLLFLPLAGWLAEHVSWRAALAPSLIGLTLAGLLAIAFIVEDPADIGLAPYGDPPPDPRAAARRRRRHCGAPSPCCAMFPAPRRSGFCSRRSSFAASAPTDLSRRISSRSARTTAWTKSRRLRRWR